MNMNESIIKINMIFASKLLMKQNLNIHLFLIIIKLHINLQTKVGNNSQA